jgi:NAD(P)-dependent dehydrogenase (short-subunit alcohol dehydrogenase family)
MTRYFFKALMAAALVTGSSAWAGLEAGKPTVLITGANRGIGLEFAHQFSERGWNVIATARNPADAEELQALAGKHEHLVIEALDVVDHAAVDALAARYKEQPIDVLLSNAAITPRYASAFKPVKGVDFDTARQSFEVNALGPLKLAQAFMDNVAASSQKKIVVMSSKAGSFEVGPQMPMMYSYRASKAALNMLMHTLSYETVKRDVTVVLLSPGTVNTTPGFNNPQGMTPEESVTKMMEVIDGLSIAQNGQFVNYEDGAVIPW